MVHWFSLWNNLSDYTNINSVDWSFFDMLCNPVPGIEFDGPIGESEDFASLQRR